MKLTLGFSPCPNDTFLFDALVHGKIDTEGLEFSVVLGDVEELNQRAFAGELDITKLSYHAYAYALRDYVLLDAGSALGRNCGPLVIAKKALSKAEVEAGTIAIPGKYTTANFLLSLAYPGAIKKEAVLFSEIEQMVSKGEKTTGLIIHESRFTYAEKGLVKIQDLGEFWETETGLPIPLGGIVIRRNMDLSIQRKVNRVLARSVRYARQFPEQTLDYVRPHAQEMDEKVMMQHINLYVNDFTEDLGSTGRAAVRRLFGLAIEREVIRNFEEGLFMVD
jgi:1,4-dihydroxy-6-naphthoate synthase